ncbi:Laccase 2 [Mycena venus]|uniref:Laccase 2 n=1 Tax=Mycena venus TaxID=2733690 RepID=A0A8H6YCY2_9AGAR|nr:Laccase 2 [Mycena venus]
MMKLLAATFPAFLSVFVAAQSASPPAKHFNDVTLDIINANLAPDGFLRSTVSANGTFPGPLIRAVKGDTLRVTVNNKLTDPTMRRSTTLDFDGIFFDTPNSFNEGTPFVTTCPFGPNVSYTYVLPLGEQTGTYWYHSQLSMQYADGLRGPLIIYDPNDPQAHLYDVDDESTIWFISDWWHNSTLPMLQSYLQTQIIPVSDSGLFNGAGRYNGGPVTPYAVSTVTKGKRYRMRLINASARSDFTVSIDNHTMTVIGTDGVATVPHTVNVIDMLAGQRYDIVVNTRYALLPLFPGVIKSKCALCESVRLSRPSATTSTIRMYGKMGTEANEIYVAFTPQPGPIDDLRLNDIGNYWINTILGGGSPRHNLNLNVTFGRGILRYEGADIAEPTGPMTLGPVDPNRIPLNEWELVPLVPIPAPPADVELTFVTSMTPNASSPSGFDSKWNINNVSYVSPEVPTLLKILEGANSDADFNKTENTFVLPANKVIQVTFPPSTEDELHPFHLHGNNFWVIKSNGSDTINEVNPIRRDVVGAGAGGTILRFTTDRPWFFHCHIFWHMNAGLASVMAAGPNETRAAVHTTGAWDDLCDAYNALPPDLQ